MSAPTVNDNVTPVEMQDIVTEVMRVLNDGSATAAIHSLGPDSGGLSGAIEKAVSEVLSLSLFDVALKGWYGLKTIKTLTGKKGPQDGKTRSVGLAEHALKVGHKPAIHFTIGEKVDLKKVTIPIDLAMTVKAISLRVRDRKIIGVSGAALQTKLTVAVEKVRIVNRDLPEYRLSEIDLETSDAGAPTTD